MDIEKLKSIAESIQIALLEKVAISDIHDFDMNVIPDDNRIEVHVFKIVPIKEIKVTLKVKRT